MNQELYLVIALLASCCLSMATYLLATRRRRALTNRVNALINSVWQVEASLRTRDWEADHMNHLHSTNARAITFDLMHELTDLAEECVQHRDVARAWLLIGRLGYCTAESRCDLALVSVAKFNRKLRQYDARLT